MQQGRCNRTTPRLPLLDGKTVNMEKMNQCTCLMHNDDEQCAGACCNLHARATDHVRMVANCNRVPPHLQGMPSHGHDASDAKRERFAKSKSASRTAVLAVFPTATSKELTENYDCFRSCEQVCPAPGSKDQEGGKRKGFVHNQQTMGGQENSMLVAEGQDMDWDATVISHCN